MDFVSGQWAVPAPQFLLCGEDHIGVEQAESVDAATAALDGVLDVPTQHLEPSADTQHRPPRSGVGGDHVGQSTRPQPAQVRDGGFAARDDDHVGVGEIRGFADPAHQYTGFAGQRLDVGGIGNPRQPDHADPQHLIAVRRHRHPDDLTCHHRQ